MWARAYLDHKLRFNIFNFAPARCILLRFHLLPVSCKDQTSLEYFKHLKLAKFFVRWLLSCDCNSKFLPGISLFRGVEEKASCCAGRHANRPLCGCQTSIQCQHVRGEFATALRGGLCLCKLRIRRITKSLNKQRLWETEGKEMHCKEKVNYFPVYCTCYNPGRKQAGKW